MGLRITGGRHIGRCNCAGYDKEHVAIDDATRLAYAELLPDEKHNCRFSDQYRGLGREPRHHLQQGTLRKRVCLPLQTMEESL